MAPQFVAARLDVPKELQDELGKLIVLLARERVFLYLHCSVFLSLNLFGFWSALKAYHDFVCDDLTKFIMALTPLMFINSLALFFLSPIKGTKREIARLKERVSYVRFQMDYNSFFN